MKRVNKILSLAAFAFILNFVCITSIFAKSVAINGGVDDIYATGGSGSAVFDKNTNTLTLNGYDNDSIIFEEFDGETINVVLKGDNKINSLALGGGYSAFGVDEDSTVTFNINAEANSSLLFKNYEYGILIPKGTLNINGGKYTFENIAGEGIHSNGDINIIDSVVSTKLAKKFIFTVGKLNIKNSDITLDGCDATAISTSDDVTIDNSEFNIKDFGTDVTFFESLEEFDILITNSNFIVTDIETLFDCFKANFEILNSNIDTTDVVNLFGANKFVATNTVINSKNVSRMVVGFPTKLEVTFTDCDITATQASSAFSSNFNSIEKTILFESKKLTFKNCNIDAVVNYIVAMSFGNIEIDNTNASLVTSYITPLVVLGYGEEEGFNTKFIIKNSKLVEDKLLPRYVVTSVNPLNDMYVYVNEEPLPEYNALNLLSLFGNTSKELHFTANNTLSFDANGGTGTMESIMVSGKIDIPVNKFTAPNGKKFKGWSLTKDGEVITELNITSNVKLYAIWENESIIEDIKEKIEEKIEDIVPDTGDKVILYIALGGLSILAISGIALHLSKKKYN